MSEDNGDYKDFLFGTSGVAEAKSEKTRGFNTGAGRRSHTTGGDHEVRSSLLDIGLRGVRDKIDPNDPVTMPGEVKVTKINNAPPAEKPKQPEK